VPQAVNCAPPRYRQQPCARVARNAVNLPAFQRIHQRILQRILRQLKITELADERGKNLPVFLAECPFNPSY
jgi:hypothetical protein